MTADAIVWLRPEYRGREDELIHLAAAADLVGVTRAALSNWAKRHENFPRIVRLVGPERRRTKWVVREEFLAFARTQLNKPRRPRRRTGPARPRAEILANQIRHHEAQMARLAELEAKQAATLHRTREVLARHKNALDETRRRLTTEAAAFSQNR